MVNEDYCSFEVAQLLKEKGFDELCIFKYSSEGVRMKSGAAIDEWQNSELDDNECSCISHQMAMKWLREMHKLHIGIVRGPKGYHITIETIPLGVVKYITREIVGTTYIDSYEEAVEAALKYALENLL